MSSTLDKKHIYIFVIISSMISFFVTLLFYYNIREQYRIITFFPIIFSITFAVLFPSVAKSKYKFTIYTFFVLQYIRFTIIPIFISLTGREGLVTPIYISDDNGFLTCLLCIADLIILSSFIYLFIKIKGNKNVNLESKELMLKGNVSTYSVFLLIALFVFAYAYFNNIHLIKFFMLDVDTGSRIGDEVDTRLLVLRQILLVGLIYFFVIVAYYSKKYYVKSKRSLFFNIALLVALINVCVIIGERRSAQIYSSICCAYVLIRCFPEKRRKILLYVFSVAGLVLLLMSIYKFSNAFLYSSYMDSLADSNADMASYSNYLQAYFMGPSNIALCIETFEKYRLSFFNVIFDFIRSVFPLSLLVKDLGIPSSIIYNNIIYNGYQNTGYILPALGYGYAVFGIFFPFLFSIINIAISLFFENLLLKTDSIELAYIYLFCLLRFCINFTVNTPALLSACTIFIFSAVTVYFIGKSVRI